MLIYCTIVKTFKPSCNSKLDTKQAWMGSLSAVVWTVRTKHCGLGLDRRPLCLVLALIPWHLSLVMNVFCAMKLKLSAIAFACMQWRRGRDGGSCTPPGKLGLSGHIFFNPPRRCLPVLTVVTS